MKSMMIHKMDDLLAETIEAKAKGAGKSINSTIKDLLMQAVGIKKVGDRENPGLKSGYRQFLGLWSAEDAAEFDKATADLQRVDESDWN